MKWFSVGVNSAIVSDGPVLGTIPADHPPVPSSSFGAGSSSSSSSARRPPPACPMHAAGTGAAGGVSTPPPVPAGVAPPKPKLTGAAKCPIVHDASSSSSSSSPGASGSGLNPLNSIPLGLSAVDRAPGQVLDLPVEREASTIPRPRTKDDDFETPYPGGADAHTTEGANGEQVWEYPSPQQFYNALVRKGWETPEESIEVMVAIHNFLNERAWEEVLKWEKRFPGGEQAQLARFQGKPGELSPKARFHLWAGKVFPSKFNTEPPFDRHDWVVTRPAVPTASPSDKPAATGADAAEEGQQRVTTRYVIDYYSAPPDEDGNPVFHLDVRPALDSFESISQRVKVGLEEFLRGQKEE